MIDEFTRESSKAKYIVVALAAVLFLLVLPAFVLAIASNMTNLELSIARNEEPVPEYEIFARGGESPDKQMWLRVPEATSDTDMYQIIRHIVSTRRSDRTYFTFYIYHSVDPKMKSRRRRSTNDSDQTFDWALKSGIRRVK